MLSSSHRGGMLAQWTIAPTVPLLRREADARIAVEVGTGVAIESTDRILAFRDRRMVVAAVSWTDPAPSRCPTGNDHGSLS